MINVYERSKRGLANGGVAPLGCKRMKQKKGHLFVDEKEKQIVQDIFVTYIRKKSICKTTDHIKEKYDIKNPRLKNMSSTKVYAILTNKTYIGVRVINSGDKENREEVPAVWEPIIDRETSGINITSPACCAAESVERNCRARARIPAQINVMSSPVLNCRKTPE